MAHQIVLLMALLIAGFVGTRVAALLRLPHSVFTVVMGVATGLVIRAHGGDYYASFNRFFPDVMLYLLLPLLVFESSYSLDSRVLRRDVLPISALAVVAMMTSTLLVGYAFHWVLGLSLLPSLTFGALISATDPVAVVALFRHVGAPKRLTHLVEAESLLNDGTAIVLFRVLLAMSLAPNLGPGLLTMAATTFVRVVLGGVVIGAGVAGVSRLLLRFTTTSGGAQAGLTLAAAYVSYLVADVYAGVSGVIATMTVGLLLGRSARLELNKAASQSMVQLWEFLALSANIVVFFAVGLSVDPGMLFRWAPYLPLPVLIVYLARALSVYTTIPFVNRLRMSERISLAYQTVLVWGGLRGGLALGLVLVLPPAFPHRETFLAAAFAVVLATLFVNALTTKPILRLLRLDRMTAHEGAVCRRALALAQDAVFSPLFLAVQRGSVSRGAFDAQRQVWLGASAPVDGDVEVEFGVTTALLTERQTYELQRLDGVLSRAAFVALYGAVEARIDLLQTAGLTALFDYVFAVPARPSLGSRVAAVLGRRTGAGLVKRLATDLEALMQLRAALAAVEDRAEHPRVRTLLRHWGAQVDARTAVFYAAYPQYSAFIQAFVLTKMIGAQCETSIADLEEAGVITQTVTAHAREQIRATSRRALADARELLRPSPARLLARVAAFRAFPKVAVRTLAESGRLRVVPAGSTVAVQGKRPGTFILVIAGILEESVGDQTQRLYTGDTLGLPSLLLGQAQAATVAAVVASEVLEIDGAAYRQVVEQFPRLLQDQIKRMAAQHGALPDNNGS